MKRQFQVKTVQAEKMDFSLLAQEFYKVLEKQKDKNKNVPVSKETR